MTSPTTKPGSLYPWPRFFGRYLDYMIVGIVLGIVIGLTAPDSRILENGYALGWISALIWIPFEALCLAVLGTTPGKALVGVSVRGADGRPLSSKDALSRSLSAWLTGCAALLPLVSLITMNTQYNRLRSGQPASWDQAGGYQVEREPLSVMRTIVLGTVLLIFLVLMALGNSSSA